jgi:heptosyltransferase-2
MVERLLIIRLSSFGDIVQCAEVAHQFKERHPRAEIHWVVRDDFAAFVSQIAPVDKVFQVARSSSFGELFRLRSALQQSPYSHVYDAHNNTRSILLIWLIWPWLRPNHWPRFRRRSKDRIKRLLLFYGRLRLLPQPFLGAVSYLHPVADWGCDQPPAPRALRAGDLPPGDWPAGFIALCPSANWELKRWPLEHWQSLIRTWSEDRFVIFGGPQDAFCEDIRRVAPDRVTNTAGALTWVQNASLLSRADLVISGDTGLMHLADYLGRPTLALIGPTAFGYPSRLQSFTLERNLRCKPCSKDGRGRCRNSLRKRCLVELTPSMLTEARGALRC